MTCPPVVMETVDMAKLKAPIVYLRLHGREGQPFLYGDAPEYYTALSAEQVRKADFQGSLVFLEGCYGLEMAQAFLDAGAAAVAGCSQPTWGYSWRIGPSSRVGRAWLENLRTGLNAADSLMLALPDIPEQFSMGWAVLGNQWARLNAPGDIV